MFVKLCNKNLKLNVEIVYFKQHILRYLLEFEQHFITFGLRSRVRPHSGIGRQVPGGTAFGDLFRHIGRPVH